MQIISIKTSPIHADEYSITDLLDKVVVALPEQTVVAVTSKIVSLCEGSVAQADTPKEVLVKQHADWYLPKESSPYGYQLTVTNSTLVASAGIDESNGDGQYVLWPRDTQASANLIREYLCAKHNLNEVGVIITDSTSRPLRRGTTGIALAHSGFEALHDYRSQQDVFGKTLHSSVANIAEGLAAAAVVAMGEGAESTPIALICDSPTVRFQKRNPTDEELTIYNMTMEEDVFAPLLTAAPWKSDRQK